MICLQQAINNLRAAAGGVNRVNSTTTEAHPELSKPNYGHSLELEDPKPELLRPQTSSGLPPGFFDNQPQNQTTGENMLVLLITIFPPLGLV